MGRHGENIRKRKDGRWEARVIDSYSLTGKAHYSYLYGKTYQEAREKKNRLITLIRTKPEQLAMQKGKTKFTFGQLMDEWLQDKKDSVKESTYSIYTCMIERHLRPELGDIPLSSVTTDILDNFLRNKLHTGKGNGLEGLAPKTVADLRSLLVMGIEYAHRRHYPCPANERLFYPKTKQPRVQVLSRSDRQKLENRIFSSDEAIGTGILLALYGGLRIGEVCALQWSDINFADETVQISKTIIRIRNLAKDVEAKTKVIVDYPKTITSIRTIPLPSFVFRYLERYRESPNAYVLTGNTAFMEPRRCLRNYKRFLKQAEVQDYSFHALRHTFATQCIEADFDPKSLSEILGHANISTTLQRYVHPSMEMKRSQMERLQKLSFYGQIDGLKNAEIS